MSVGGVLNKQVYFAFVTLLFSSFWVNASSECVPVGEVLIPADRSSLSYPSLINRVQNDSIILLGEHHDNISHHRWQLQMITGLHTLNPNLVLGFEMFPRRVQPILDQWVRGEFSEEEFLKQVGWSDYWRFDPALYTAIFHYARMNRIPMRALNVERSLIRAVGKKGWKGVDNKAKEGVGRAAPPSEGYRQMLAGVFMQHGVHHAKDKGEEQDLAEVMRDSSFIKFVESQQVWDRAMAEGISNTLNSYPDAKVVAILGSGHMMYDFGVPEQLFDINGIKPTVLIPWDPEFECGYIQNNFADAVIGLKAIRFSELESRNKYPKIGIYLDKHAVGVLVGKIMEGSIGEDIKLKTVDVIIKMAGETVSEVNDVIDIVKSTRFGTWLPFVVLREGKHIEFVAKFPAQK